MEIKLTSQNFEKEVKEYKGTVLVDFWASWCGPCKMLSPVLEEFAKEHPEIKVGKVNVDEENALASAFGIMSIPTLILFEDGKPTSTTMGYMPKEQIEKFTL